MIPDHEADRPSAPSTRSRGITNAMAPQDFQRPGEVADQEPTPISENNLDHLRSL